MKTKRHCLCFYVTQFPPGDWNLANLSASSHSWTCWSWGSLPPGPPNVKSVHLPIWPDVGANWLCSCFYAPGRTQSTASPKPVARPQQTSQKSENFQSWPAMLDICVPEPGTLKPHSKPTGPTLAISWSSHLPFLVNFWNFCMFRAGQL